jgi:hypothetical protein
MNPSTSRLLSVGVAAALLAACGGSGATSGTPASSSATTTTPQTGNLAMLVSDASTEDWAAIDVKVLSIALVPQGGGSNVTVYTAPAMVPMVNLAQLDQIAEILGNVSVPVGTYTAAVLTISGNPGDVALTVSASPEAGFAAAAGTPIPTADIQIQHTKGSAPNLTVPVTVNFAAPLVVSAGQSNALDLEFELSHPAFLVGHVPPGTGTTLWAVNFDGPIRHHRLADLTHLVLRHLYGDVTAIATDNSAVTVTKEFPTEPAVSPETAIATTQSLQILADAANGTIFYDVDANTRTIIKDFSSETSLTGKQVRIAARYQEDGTLVATRIWASSQFNSVWLSPEGHVLHVDAANDIITVASESGGGVDLTVNASTQFFYRQPANPSADAAPIATGTAFLASKNLVRGFKVHASVVDPLATPLVAQSIDIETATYSGQISASDTTGFTLTRLFRMAKDDYAQTLNYISSATANGTDGNGNLVDGYKWWNFAYPTLVTTGTAAIPDFISATNGSVSFGGSVGSVTSQGVSYVIWNDPANMRGWAAADTILMPSLLPLGFVANGLVNNEFTMTVLGGSSAATVALSTTSGSATLVYQVDCTNGVVTVSPIDITTSAGLTSLTSGLGVNAPVKVYGVPQADGTLKAYVLTYFTGQAPAQ